MANGEEEILCFFAKKRRGRRNSINSNLVYIWKCLGMVECSNLENFHPWILNIQNTYLKFRCGWEKVVFLWIISLTSLEFWIVVRNWSLKITLLILRIEDVPVSLTCQNQNNSSTFHEWDQKKVHRLECWVRLKLRIFNRQKWDRREKWKVHWSSIFIIDWNWRVGVMTDVEIW